MVNKMVSKTNNCSMCVFNKSLNTCNSCTINPLFSNKFTASDKYYPLEINGTHINLWSQNGKTKISIAIFKHNASENEWDLEFIGIRTLDPRVDWIILKKLITIGYNTLENTTASQWE